MDRWPVLILVEYLDHGGCERDAAKIAIGLDRSRFEPHVAVFHAGGYRTPEIEAAGVPIVELPVRSFANATVWHGARQLAAYLRQHRIQVVHAFDVPTDILVAPVARSVKTPVILTSQLSYRNMYARSRQIALRLADRLSDRVVVNSRAVGESLRREWGLKEEQIYLCYNGVDPEEFHPGPGTRPPGFEDALIIGSVCAMRKEKRMDWVLRAFKEILRSNPAVRLVLVGSGPEVSGLMALRDELQLGDACYFEPGKPRVAGWMRGMDIYINSSVSESFPNALLEAMACGCCVIGSKVGGIPELITHGVDGLVFDTHSFDDLVAQLRRAVKEASLRQAMRCRAVDTAHQRFSMRINLERTESLYEMLLEEKGIHRLVKSPASC